MADSKQPAEVDQPSTQETLEWESAHRRVASIGSIVAGLGIIIGTVIQVAAEAGAPKITLLDAFHAADTLERVDLRVASFTYVSNHGGALVLGYVLQGGAFLAAILGVGYLYRATSARNPNLRRWTLPVVLVGLVLLGLSTAVLGAGLVAKAHSFAHSADHSHHAANQVVVDNPFIRFSSFMRFFGGLAFAFGLAMISLNAMRCGLLTRFLGVLGIIAGVLYVFPLGTPLYPVPFVFWLIFLGVLIGGHWFSGVPPAWASGQAEPWPTSQQIREQREAQRAQRGGGGGRGAGRKPAPSDEEPSDTVTAGAQHPSSKKRKRKRR